MQYHNLSVSMSPSVLTHSKTSPSFYVFQVKVAYFENVVEKGEIVGYEQNLLFSQYFQPFCKSFCPFHQIQNCCLQTL